METLLQKVTMYRLILVDGVPAIVPDQISAALDEGAVVKAMAKGGPCAHCQRGTYFLIIVQGDAVSRSDHLYCLNCGEEAAA